MTEKRSADGSKREGRTGGIVCAGNWIVDIVHTIDRYPHQNEVARIAEETIGIGGGAANVTTNLRALARDIPLYPVGCLARDDHARKVLDHCRRLDVPTDWLTRIEGEATGHTHVMNVPGNSRTFFYAGGANDVFSGRHVPVENLARTGAGIFYLGYVMLLAALDVVRNDATTAAGELLARARAAGMTTCVDLVSATREDYAAVVAASLPHVDFLLLNELELSRASGCAVSADDGPQNRTAMTRAAQRLIDCGVRGAVIVHTPRTGLWLSADGTATWCDAEPARDIVSAVGAGDGFCAGILCGLHRGWEPDRCLALAHRVGRRTLAAPTATAPASALAGLA